MAVAMTRAYLTALKQHIKADDLHWFYTSAPWLNVRAEALKIQHYECQRCKELYNKIEPATIVHHIHRVRKYPQYALSIYVDGKINLLAVCDNCHWEIHHSGKTINQSKISKKFPERW